MYIVSKSQWSFLSDHGRYVLLSLWLYLSLIHIYYRDNIYSSTELVSDEYGNLSSWFDLPMSLDEGDYLIKLSWKNSDFYRMVSIENYEKPSFEAEVKTEKETYANREKVTVKVQANYYSGQPLTPDVYKRQKQGIRPLSSGRSSFLRKFSNQDYC